MQENDSKSQLSSLGPKTEKEHQSADKKPYSKDFRVNVSLSPGEVDLKVKAFRSEAMYIAQNTLDLSDQESVNLDEVEEMAELPALESQQRLSKISTLSKDQFSRQLSSHMKQTGILNPNEPIDISAIKTTKLYKELIKILKQVDILKEDDKVLKVSDLDEIIDVIQIEKYQKNEVVFNYGDDGDKFYIILGGETACMLPNREEIDDWEARYKQYQLLLEDIKQREIHAHKELLVNQREQELLGNVQHRVSTKDKKRREDIKSGEKVKRHTQTMKPKISVMLAQQPLEPQLREAHTLETIKSDESSQVWFSSSESPQRSVEIQLERVQSNEGFAKLKGSSKQKLLEMRAESIMKEFQARVEELKPGSCGVNSAEAVNKLVKRLKRLDIQSEKINQPLFSGFGVDPILKASDKEAQKDGGESTDASLLEALMAQRAAAKALYLHELSEKQVKKLTKRQLMQLIRENTEKMSSIKPEHEQRELKRTWLKEFKRLTTGEYFGELALQTRGVKRAATMICTKSSVYAVIKKEDYNRVLMKAQTRQKQNVNQFLKDMPIFKHWTQKALTNLQFYMKKMAFIRHQELYCEGTEQSYVYLIISGVFKYTKRKQESLEKEVAVEKLIGPKTIIPPSAFENLTVVNAAVGDRQPQNAAKVENLESTGSTLCKRKLQGIFKLAEYQQGKFLADDDYFSDSTNHFGTVTCSSRTGMVYQISIADFRTKILNRYDMKEKILTMVEEKTEQVRSRMEMIGGIYSITPNQIREEALLERQTKKPSTSHQTSHKQTERPSMRNSRPASASEFGGRSPNISQENVSVSFNQSLQLQEPSKSNFNMISASHSINEDSVYMQQNTTSIQGMDQQNSIETGSKVVPTPIQMEYPPQVSTFRPVNKTRRIQYPRVVKKYNVHRPSQMYFDDFRWAMGKIVKSKNHSKNQTEPDLVSEDLAQQNFDNIQSFPSISKIPLKTDTNKLLEKNMTKIHTRSVFNNSQVIHSQPKKMHQRPKQGFGDIKSRSLSPDDNEPSRRKSHGGSMHQTQSRFSVKEGTLMNLKSDYQIQSSIGMTGDGRFKMDTRKNAASQLQYRSCNNAKITDDGKDYVQSLLLRKNVKKQKSFMAVDQISKLFMSRNAGLEQKSRYKSVIVNALPTSNTYQQVKRPTLGVSTIKEPVRYIGVAATKKKRLKSLSVLNWE